MGDKLLLLMVVVLLTARRAAVKSIAMAILFVFQYAYFASVSIADFCGALGRGV